MPSSLASPGTEGRRSSGRVKRPAEGSARPKPPAKESRTMHPSYTTSVYQAGVTPCGVTKCNSAINNTVPPICPGVPGFRQAHYVHTNCYHRSVANMGRPKDKLPRYCFDCWPEYLEREGVSE